MDPRRLKAVAYAKSQVGPGNITHYWASCGISPAPDPKSKWGQWCGVFTLTCLHEAEIAEAVMWLTGLGFLYPQHLPITKDPQPADVMYVDHPYRHHGLVVSLKDGILTSVEGNTPDVKLRSRPLPEGVTFYSIAPLLNEPLPVPVPKPRPTEPAPPPGGIDTSLIQGLDVSHYQDPSRINWVAAAKAYKFAIVKAAYATSVDKAAAEHVKRARDVGMKVGLYLFYRPQFPVEAQLEVFGNVAESVGMGPGWLAPSIDVEPNAQFGDGVFTGARYALADAIADTWREHWGSALVYMGEPQWEELGKPEWVRENHLWIPNYNPIKNPPTPFGMPWLIWQHKVSPIPGIYGSKIDQNVARALPLIPEPRKIPFLDLDPDWEAMRRDRDKLVQEDDGG